MMCGLVGIVNQKSTTDALKDIALRMTCDGGALGLCGIRTA